jgi:hypothetical protein
MPCFPPPPRQIPFGILAFQNFSLSAFSATPMSKNTAWPAPSARTSHHRAFGYCPRQRPTLHTNHALSKNILRKFRPAPGSLRTSFFAIVRAVPHCLVPQVTARNAQTLRCQDPFKRDARHRSAGRMKRKIADQPTAQWQVFVVTISEK